MQLLECLDALLREKSVTRAAERLQMSQGNMSNSLSRLRNLLNDPLLVRTARGMVPTPHALKLQSEAHELVYRLQALMEVPEVHDLSTVSSSIKIACVDATALFALDELVERIRKVAPNLQLEISQISHMHVKEPLDNGSIDLALGAYPDLSDILMISRVTEGAITCVVSRDSVFAKTGISFDQYCEAPHALLSVGYGFRATIETVIDDTLAELGRQRTTRLTSQYATVIASAVARSDLITTMPQFMLQHFSKTLPLVGIDLPIEIPPVPLYMVWHPRTRDNWVLSWFREELRGHLSKQGV